MEMTWKATVTLVLMTLALAVGVAPASAQISLPDTCMDKMIVDSLGCVNLPDLVTAEITGEGHPDGSATLKARVGNVGMGTAPAGVEVAFYEAETDDCSRIGLLGTTQTTIDLTPGKYEYVSVNVNSIAHPYELQIRACADDDGTWYSGTHGTGSVDECNDDNNCCCSFVAVNCTLGGITGRKYFDENMNGTWDPFEQGLSGWKIRLEGSDGYTEEQWTGGGGGYSFDWLTPGVAYTLTEINQKGWIQTEPPTGAQTVTLNCSEWRYDVDFGNSTCSTSGDFVGCPPRDPIGYWPFNDYDIVNPPGGTGIWGGQSKDLINGNTARSQLYPNSVGLSPDHDDGCLVFTGNGWMEVDDAPELNFGTGKSFTLAGWVYLDSNDPSTHFAMFNKGMMRDPWYEGAWALHLVNRTPTLLVNDPAGPISWEFSGDFQVPWDVWTYVAVTVDRSASGKVKFYKCGVLKKTYNYAPGGDLTNSADLWFGRSGDAPGGENAKGKMDEFIIFDRALYSYEISRLCGLYTDRCLDFMYVTRHLSYGNTDMVETAYLTIKNNTLYPQDYRWSVAGLAAGPGCDVDGPTTFNPPMGTISGLLPGMTESIPIVITRPDGLDHGVTACFAVTIMAIGSDDGCIVLEGTLHGDDDHSAPSGPIHGLAFHDPRWINWEVTATGSSSTFDYRIIAEPVNADSGNNFISLDGLPPGATVTGSISTPAGVPVEIGAQVELQAYRATVAHEMRLERNLGGGNYRPIATALVVSEEAFATGVADASADAAGETAAEGDAPSAARIVGIAPTPFNPITTIAFQLEHAGMAKLQVFAPSGRLIATLADGPFTPGRHSIRWNGTTDTGAPAASGVYFARVESAEATGVMRMVLIR